MDIFDSKRRNKTTIFVLPLIFSNISYKTILQDHFIMSYLTEDLYEEPADGIIIEYDQDVVTFKIPNDKLKDYKLIINSQYSQISEESKQIILSFWEETKNSYLYSVLYKTNKILDYWNKKFPEFQIVNITEYYPKFNMIDETRNAYVLRTSYKFNYNNKQENDDNPIIK